MDEKKKKTSYEKLFEAVVQAYSSSKNKSQLQEMTNEIWKTVKMQFKVPGAERDKAADLEIKKLIEKSNRKKAAMSHFFAQVSFRTRILEL